MAELVDPPEPDENAPWTIQIQLRPKQIEALLEGDWRPSEEDWVDYKKRKGIIEEGDFGAQRGR